MSGHNILVWLKNYNHKMWIWFYPKHFRSKLPWLWPKVINFNRAWSSSVCSHFPKTASKSMNSFVWNFVHKQKDRQTHTWTNTDIQKNTHTDTHTQTRTHTDTHTHTHTQKHTQTTCSKNITLHDFVEV